MIQHIKKRRFIITAFLLGVLAIGLVVVFQPRSTRSNKPISTAEGINESGILMANCQTRDFPEHGVLLIGPSNPSFAKLAQLMKSNEDSVTDLPPVFLQNTSKYSIVGYRITWECVDSRGDTDVRDVSNVISYVFLHGDKSERIQALASDARVIGPNSTWFISLDRPTERVEDISAGQTDKLIPGSRIQKISNACSKVTISVDGVFFDDGTFIGPNTTAFFLEVKTQMDARYEILSKVESDLRSGVKVQEIIRELEQIVSQPMPELRESPSQAEYLSSFRIIFAKNILGMKRIHGVEKAMGDVHQQLSKPWVPLRKL